MPIVIHYHLRSIVPFLHAGFHVNDYHSILYEIFLYFFLGFDLMQTHTFIIIFMYFNIYSLCHIIFLYNFISLL